MCLGCKSNVRPAFDQKFQREIFNFFSLYLVRQSNSSSAELDFFFFLFTFIHRCSPLGVSNLFKVSPIRYCRLVSGSLMWLSKQQGHQLTRGFSFNVPVQIPDFIQFHSVRRLPLLSCLLINGLKIFIVRNAFGEYFSAWPIYFLNIFF